MNSETQNASRYRTRKDSIGKHDRDNAKDEQPMVMHIDHNEFYCIKKHCRVSFSQSKVGATFWRGLFWAWGVCDPMHKFGASWRRSNGQSGYSKMESGDNLPPPQKTVPPGL